MSEFREELDSTNRICPYCKDEVHQEGEDFHDEMEVEQCDECGKRFHTVDYCIVYHKSIPDCKLNGGVCVPGNFNRCGICGTWMKPDRG